MTCYFSQQRPLLKSKENNFKCNIYFYSTSVKWYKLSLGNCSHLVFLRQTATLNVIHRKAQGLAGRREYYSFTIVINIRMMVFKPLPPVRLSWHRHHTSRIVSEPPPLWGNHQYVNTANVSNLHSSAYVICKRSRWHCNMKYYTELSIYLFKLVNICNPKTKPKIKTYMLWLILRKFNVTHFIDFRTDKNYDRKAI